jgi:hypothetical protein
MKTTSALLAVVSTALFALACDERVGSRSPTGPIPAIASTGTLSGVVFEPTSQGDVLLPGLEFEIHTRFGPFLGTVTSDATGRYTLPDVPRGTQIALALAYAGLPVGQQCVASTTVEGDTVLDVELTRVHGSSRLPRSPTVSGVVFETPPAGRQPIPHASVYYDWNCLDGTPEAWTVTDANGHYELCRLPRGGCIVVVVRDGRFTSVSIDVQHDTRLDIAVPARGVSTSRR